MPTLLTTQAEIKHRKNLIRQIVESANLTASEGDRLRGDEKYLVSASTSSLEQALRRLKETEPSYAR